MIAKNSSKPELKVSLSELNMSVKDALACRMHMCMQSYTYSNMTPTYTHAHLHTHTQNYTHPGSDYHCSRSRDKEAASHWEKMWLAEQSSITQENTLTGEIHHLLHCYFFSQCYFWQSTGDESPLNQTWSCSPVWFFRCATQPARMDCG